MNANYAITDRRHSAFRFALFCTLLLLASVWLDPLMGPLNRATAALSGNTLALFGFAPQVRGDMISLTGFTVRIVSECTSLYATLLLAAFILATPATWRERLAGIVTGSAVIGVVNLLRIAVVTVIGARNKVQFEIIHVYLGQVVMLLLVLGCCLAWRHWCSGERGALMYMFRAVCWATILFLPWMMVHKVYLALLDSVVRLFFSLINPHYSLSTPRPLLIYNHALSIPVFVAMVISSSWVSRRRLFIGGGIGVLVLAFWHALFRVTHVILTAYDVPEIEPLHQTVYLISQFLLPLFFWLMIAGSPRRVSEHVRGNKSVTSFFMFCILTALLLICPAVARAQASLSIQPGGDGVYQLRASGLNGMTAGEFNIGYQPDGDDRPRVTGVGLGASAALQVDISSSNISIQLRSPRPLRGVGLLASIQVSGVITYLSATLQNENGNSEVPLTQVVVPPGGMKSRKKASRPETNEAKETEPMTQSQSQPPPASNSGVPVKVTVPGPLESVKIPAGPVRFRRVESVLERLRTFNGERTPAALRCLFAPVAGDEFHQEPAVVLTDGQNELLAHIGPAADGDEIRCFLIRGAHFCSLRKGDGGEWLLSVVPDRGMTEASITVLTLKSLVEYPLTVAPPLDLFNSEPRPADDQTMADYVTAANMIAEEILHKKQNE